MSRTPSYEYEALHQFEAIFRDGEHKTQAATRDYQRVWENVINNPPEDGVTPVVVYRMNGRTCAAISGLDDLVDNEECAMEIARLASRVAELEAREAKLRKCVEAGDNFVHAVVTIESSPGMMSVYTIAEAHHCAYNGANWSGELANYRAAREEVDRE